MLLQHLEDGICFHFGSEVRSLFPQGMLIVPEAIQHTHTPTHTLTWYTAKIEVLSWARLKNFIHSTFLFPFEEIQTQIS